VSPWLLALRPANLMFLATAAATTASKPWAGAYTQPEPFMTQNTP